MKTARSIKQQKLVQRTIQVLSVWLKLNLPWSSLPYIYWKTVSSRHGQFLEEAEKGNRYHTDQPPQW